MQAPPGPLYSGPDKGGFDAQPIADMAPITIGGGHKAYGVYIMPGMGFRNNNARDLPIDDEPAGIHVVVDGGHYSNGCCFNYGNASTNGLAVGTGTMESVYIGTSTAWGSGSGPGPPRCASTTGTAGRAAATPTPTRPPAASSRSGAASTTWSLRW